MLFAPTLPQIKKILEMDMRQKKCEKGTSGREYRGYLGIFMFFFTFFLIFLVVSSLIYAQSLKTHRERFEQEMVKGLTEFSKEWERNVQQVYEAGYKLLYNEAFARLIPKSGEKAGQQDILELTGWMELHAASVSDYAEDVFLYYDDDYVITEQGMSDFSLYFDVVREHERYPSAEWRKLLERGDAVYGLVSEKVHEKYSGGNEEAVMPLVISRNINGRQVVLGTEVSAYRLQENFLRRRMMDEQGIICLDGEGNVFFSGGGASFSEEANRVLSGLVGETPVVLASVQLDGREWITAGCRSERELDFFLLTPKKLFREQIFQGNGFMLLFFLLTMVLFFILTLIYTRRIYHPLHSVAQKLALAENGREPAELTKGISEELDRFWNRNRTILDFQKRLMEKNFDEMVHAILWGEKQDRELLADYLEIAGVRTQKMGCLICQVDFLENYYYEFKEHERELIEKNLPFLLQQMMDGKEGCCLVPDSGSRCICFFEWRENVEEFLTELVKPVQELFAGDTDCCRIRCGISSRASAEVRDVRRIVWEAQTALRLEQAEEAVSSGENGRLIMEYNAEMVQFGICFSRKEKNQLMNFLAGGQEEKAHGLLEKILKENREAGVYEGLLKLLYFELYHVGYDFLFDTVGENPEKAEQLWNQILLMEENANAGGETALKEFYSACIAMTSKKEKQDKQDNALEKVFAYITEHFAEGIYLENVAEAVEISPKYLSRVFKERTGVNLSEYISLVRITRAKELLLSTSKSVGEIGELVGFENRTTFFRTFKKLEGVSPNEYRKNTRQ